MNDGEAISDDENEEMSPEAAATAASPRPTRDDVDHVEPSVAFNAAQKAKMDELAELERQYQDYRKQFEEWKTQNSKLAGTPAYEQYVSQFDDWEADVDKRRKNIQLAALRADRKEKEHQAAAAARRAAEKRERQRREQDDMERRQQHHQQHNQQQQQQQQQQQYSYRYHDTISGERLEAISPEPLSDEVESPSATPPPVNTTQVFDRPAQKKIRISRFSAATLNIVSKGQEQQQQQQHLPPPQQQQQQQLPPHQMQHQSTAQFAAHQVAQQKALQAQQQYQNDQYQANQRLQQPPPQQQQQQQQLPPQQQQQQKVLAQHPAQPPAVDDLRDIECLEPYTFMTGMLHLMNSQPMTAVAIMLASEHTLAEDEEKPVQGPQLPASSNAAKQAIAADATASSSAQFGSHAPFDASDPLYRRWGERAAPPGYKTPFEQTKLPPMSQPPPGYGAPPPNAAAAAVSGAAAMPIVNGAVVSGPPPTVPPPNTSQAPSQRSLPFTGPPPGAPIPPGWQMGTPIRFDPHLPPPAREYRTPKMPFRDFSVKS